MRLTRQEAPSPRFPISVLPVSLFSSPSGCEISALYKVSLVLRYPLETLPASGGAAYDSALHVASYNL